ncbi:Hypothetical protein PFR_JS12-3_28 [Propionibacterium freudenreichii]|nr:Hypothetical protein PFR_JS12-3_28 [Propionibacterium freudenreichii]
MSIVYPTRSRIASATHRRVYTSPVFASGETAVTVTPPSVWARILSLAPLEPVSHTSPSHSAVLRRVINSLVANSNGQFFPRWTYRKVAGDTPGSLLEPTDEILAVY